MTILFHGDCFQKLQELNDNSVDAIVTDPPYGIRFMGKAWDYDVPSSQIWTECIRVLKPGGHLLSFFGTRTYHRGVVRIEDAGFEIRDQIQWIYGSGFPKSHNIKEGGFKGWGTALKPANEPIVVARKPLEKGLTIAENVLKYGTGAINVDECRIGYSSEADKKLGQSERPSRSKGMEFYSEGEHDQFDRSDRSQLQGRWPANVIFDEVTGCAEWSRFFYVAKASKRERNEGLEGMPLKESGIKNDSGRGFSESDPHKIILNQNHHPTVKPIKLMEYLIKLVTPPNGTVLDPFMGSGSTGVAAKRLGFKFVGVEMNDGYFEISKRRIEDVGLL